MSTKKFVTAINCMDGRVQLPVIDWMKKHTTADFVDMITEPGPNKILAENNQTDLLQSLKKRVEISVLKHASTQIAIIGHFDCAGNPVDKETQLEQIKTAVQTIQSWGFQIPVIGLWVDDHWTVHKIL
ncbi:MAG TPA: carbonic anhydrase [Candidatus Thermoplasmatota archaeon]|nr:carbonic anhydrase [Candidatus Thermoplasmatota archaeon]